MSARTVGRIINSSIARTAIVVVAGWLCLGPVDLAAQEIRGATKLDNEFGFWVGASNPVPGTKIADVLDSSIGGGAFYRLQWPWVFFIETGFAYTHYQSRTTQALSVAPLYAALVYRLPLPWRIQIYFKAGGGTTWLEVRPQNRNGWDPLGYAGTEFSIQAGRRFRIGLRVDYNVVYEEHLEDPRRREQELLLLMGGDNTDLRFQQANQFELENGYFWHFGLMVSFYF